MSLIWLSWSTLHHKGLRLLVVKANSNCLLGYNAVQTCMWIPTFWGPTDTFPSSSRHEMQTAVPPTRLHAFATKNSAPFTFTDVHNWRPSVLHSALDVQLTIRLFHRQKKSCRQSLDRRWESRKDGPDVTAKGTIPASRSSTASVSQFTELSYRTKMPTDQTL
jgi:hypothetical protein